MKGVSAKTHTKKQLDDYSNQNNPNNKAYKANRKNITKTKANNIKRKYDVGRLDGESFGWCDD